AKGVAFYASWDTIVNGTSIGLAPAVAVSVGLLSAIYPALRAAALDPLDAWRYEYGGVRLRSWLRPLRCRPAVSALVPATPPLRPVVNAAIFSLTREVLLRPLPYRDAERLVRVFEASAARGQTSAPVAPARLLAWRERVNALESIAPFRRVAFNVSIP